MLHVSCCTFVLLQLLMRKRPESEIEAKAATDINENRGGNLTSNFAGFCPILGADVWEGDATKHFSLQKKVFQ